MQVVTSTYAVATKGAAGGERTNSTLSLGQARAHAVGEIIERPSRADGVVHEHLLPALICVSLCSSFQ